LRRFFWQVRLLQRLFSLFSSHEKLAFRAGKTWKTTVQQNRLPDVFVLFVYFVLCKRNDSE